MSSNNTVNIHVSPGLKLAWELTRHPDSSSTVPSPSEVEQSPSDTDVSAADQPPVSVPHEQALSQAFVANTSEGLSGKWSDNFAITYDDAQTLIKLKRDLWTFGRSQTADLADGGSRFKSQREWETFQEHNATDRQAVLVSQRYTSLCFHHYLLLVYSICVNRTKDLTAQHVAVHLHRCFQ